VKALPCQRCKEVALLPDGKPYVVGRAPTFPSRGAFTYGCSRCRQAWDFNSITATEFARLPTLTLADLRKLGLDWKVTNDLKGSGVTEEQIDELERANVDWHQLHR
jgi:hypothetical protein